MQRRYKPSVFILACLLGDISFNPLLAKDFGIWGHTFPIEEENLQHYIQRQLASKASSQDKEVLTKCLLQFIENPTPIPGIRHATTARSFLIDPTYEAKNDVVDTKGTLVVRRGTRINPLDHVILSSGLLFIDGDQEEHVLWAREQKGLFKWVLVKGHPLQLEEKEKRPIYFDQQGFYTTKFHIEQVPAKVMQQGNRLLVEEIPSTNKGGTS
jgi:conjugal transfer pilus assembly protein TraW